MLGIGRFAIGIGITGITIAVVHKVVTKAKEEDKPVKEVVKEAAADVAVKTIKFVAKHQEDIASITSALVLVGVILDIISHFTKMKAQKNLNKRLDELEKLVKANLKVNLVNGMNISGVWEDVVQMSERLNIDSMSSERKDKGLRNLNDRMAKVFGLFSKAFPNIADVEVAA